MGSRLTQFSREPDFDAPELRAYDATDLLILESASQLRASEAGSNGARAPHIVTIGDRHGALTLGAAHLLGATGIRAYQDPLLAERALDANAGRVALQSCFTHHELGESLLHGASLVLMQLPRSLAELQEIAWHIARYAAPEVVVLAGGRDKHMARAMNDVFSLLCHGVGEPRLAQVARAHGA